MKVAVALSVGLFLADSRAATAGAPATRVPDGAGAPSAADTSAAPEAAVDGAVDELGLTADDYAASLDYDTTYDDSVAQAYDDGYSEDAYQTFRDTLAPYGTWVDDPAYGEVWVPSVAVVGQDFSPYATNGDWVDTEYGWTWDSGWAWGWAPFHYGRWTTIEGHGWGWVPGTIWGPAWVAWRAGSGCVGWAPLPPHGVALGSPLGRHSPWRFVGASSFGRSHGVYLPASVVPRVFGQMSVVSNARRLGAGRAAVTVNVGPTLRGRAAAREGTARLASVAPSVLPRIAVQPRPGVAIEGRSWVRAGVTQQLAFAPATPMAGTVVRGGVTGGSLGLLGRTVRPSNTVSGRGPVGAVRSVGGRTGIGGPMSSHVSAPGNAPVGRMSSAPYGAAPVYRPFYQRSASSGQAAAAPPPAWRASAPRFSAPTAPFTAPMTGFTAPSAGFTGSTPATSGGRSSFGGGGGARSFGGGHQPFRGGGGGGGHRR